MTHDPKETNGSPCQPGDAAEVYDSLEAEVNAFHARLVERFGITALAIFYQCPPDQASPVSGRMVRGDGYSVYSYCRKYCIEMEQIWREQAKDDYKELADG